MLYTKFYRRIPYMNTSILIQFLALFDFLTKTIFLRLKKCPHLRDLNISRKTFLSILFTKTNIQFKFEVFRKSF